MKLLTLLLLAAACYASKPANHTAKEEKAKGHHDGTVDPLHHAALPHKAVHPPLEHFKVPLLEKNDAAPRIKADAPARELNVASTQPAQDKKHVKPPTTFKTLLPVVTVESVDASEPILIAPGPKEPVVIAPNPNPQPDLISPNPNPEPIVIAPNPGVPEPTLIAKPVITKGMNGSTLIRLYNEIIIEIPADGSAPKISSSGTPDLAIEVPDELLAAIH